MKVLLKSKFRRMNRKNSKCGEVSEKKNRFGILITKWQKSVRLSEINPIPQTIEQLEQGDEQWKTALDSKMESLKENQTWSVVDGNVPKKSIHSKGFSTSKKMDSWGYGWWTRAGSNYSVTLSPVASMTVILSTVNEMKMLIHQMDVKMAFPDGKLDEDIYTQLPKLGKFKLFFYRKVCMD